MEMDLELPKYTREGILSMDPAWFSILRSELGIPPGPDDRIRIIHELARRGELKFPAVVPSEWLVIVPEAWRGEVMVLVDLFNRVDASVIQNIVINYSYARIKTLCEIIPQVILYPTVPEKIKIKMDSLNKIICNSQFFWKVKTQQDFEIAYTEPPKSRTWRQDYEFVLNENLLDAVWDTKMDTISELLAWGADLNVEDDDGETALILASKRGSINIVKELLRAGADPNFRNFKGETAIIVAVENYNYWTVLALLRGGADPNTKINGSPLIMRVLLRNPFLDPNYHISDPDDKQRKTLSRQVSQMFKFFWSHGDVNIRNSQGQTILMVLVDNFSVPLYMITRVLEAGADPNLQDNDGNTALMMAGKRFASPWHPDTYESFAVSQALLAAGANPNLRNNQGETSLIISIRKYDVKLVRVLLEAGANPNFKTVTGETAMDIALYNLTIFTIGDGKPSDEAVEIVDLLKSYS